MTLPKSLVGFITHLLSFCQLVVLKSLKVNDIVYMLQKQ